ncbi:MAG: hypothetical protein M3032_11010 [Verrucomicrobiota bacterium]|nr:hypothetical protein [Verrucomicrobiota bacterium]
MKKYLLIGFLIAAGVASAGAQTQSFTAPTASREQAQQRRAPQPVRRGAIGAFPRAARGNPVMLLVPGAPRKYYGAPQDTVTTTPYHEREHYTHSDITGLILFGLAW